MMANEAPGAPPRHVILFKRLGMLGHAGGLFRGGTDVTGPLPGHR